jgi:hypothetical protein
MKKQFLLTALLLISISLISTGCVQQVKEIKDITKQTQKDLSEAKIEARDAQRVSNIKIFHTTLQLYALDAKKLPSKQDANRNYQSFKLIKNSSDFKTVESELKSIDSSFYIPVDPNDPNRYIEFYSDNEIYWVKTFLTQKSDNCEMNTDNYCVYTIQGTLENIFN